MGRGSVPRDRTGSLESLRELNLLRVVDALRSHGKLSRAEIARRTGLSRTTISTLVGDLLARGFVAEHPEANGANPGRGRPPLLLSLDPSAGVVIGVDFDHDRVRVAVGELSRTILAESVKQLDVDHDAVGAIDAAAGLVRSLLDEAAVDQRRVLGVGVAIAGPVDPVSGSAYTSSILPSWSGLDAANELSARLGLPVHLDNDANLGALAEVTLGAGRNARNAAYVQMSSGIGAGLIVDGRPYRGAGGVAGEIGHIAVDESGAICRCGNRGCLETIASGPALVRLLAASRGGQISVAEMIALAEEGDLGSRRVIADAGRAVGRVVAALCNLFNPEMIVVGGDLSQAGENLLGPLRESVQRTALPATTRDLTVVAGELGDRANVLGALALAIAQSEHAVAARIAAPAEAGR
jgi:predicted NBD/HSP70 family sugar kinase